MTLRLVNGDPKQRKLIESLEKKYAAYLDSCVDDIFHTAADQKDWSWPQLARAAGLSYSTVLKLGNRGTRRPQHMTVWKLARAVGLRYEIQAPPVALRRQAG